MMCKSGTLCAMEDTTHKPGIKKKKTKPNKKRLNKKFNILSPRNCSWKNEVALSNYFTISDFKGIFLQSRRYTVQLYYRVQTSCSYCRI